MLCVNYNFVNLYIEYLGRYYLLCTAMIEFIEYTVDEIENHF